MLFFSDRTVMITTLGSCCFCPYSSPTTVIAFGSLLSKSPVHSDRHPSSFSSTLNPAIPPPNSKYQLLSFILALWHYIDRRLCATAPLPLRFGLEDLAGALQVQDLLRDCKDKTEQKTKELFGIEVKLGLYWDCLKGKWKRLYWVI